MEICNGEKIMLFKSLDLYETPKAIESICHSYQIALEEEFVDPLILIPCVILDFLCVHPFSDGNVPSRYQQQIAA